MLRTLCRLVCCAAALALAQAHPAAQAQEPAAVIPPPSAAVSESTTKIIERPVAPTPLLSGQQLYLMGEFNQAIEQYTASLRGTADDAAVYAGIARADMKLNKTSDAFAAAWEAVQIDPFLASAHAALGEVYLRQAQLFDAQTQFLFPFKQGQQDARSYLGLERIYLASFNFKRAKVAIDKARALDPNDPEISADWLNTRPVPERIQAMETLLAAAPGFYGREALDDIRHDLAVLQDSVRHPERTCTLAAQGDRNEIQLVSAGDSDHRSPLLALEVGVNGVNSRLVAATGNAEIVISGKIAKKAHIEPIVRTENEGLGSQNPPESYVGFVRSLKIGTMEFRDCYVTVDEHVAPNSFYDYFEGSFDLAYFRDYLVDLNMPRARLVLSSLPQRPADDAEAQQMNATDPDAAKFHDRYVAPEMSQWTPMYAFARRLAIPAQVNASPPELFDISTAAQTNILEVEFARQWSTLTSDPPTGPPPFSISSMHLPAMAAPRVFGANGRISALFTGPVTWKFSGLSFAAPWETAMNLSSVNNRDGIDLDGILGFATLHNLRLTLDFRDGLIHFDNTLSYTLR